MLVAKKLSEYIEEYNPTWSVDMPENCPPEDIEVPFSHLFYRMSANEDKVVDDDWKTYSEISPMKDWGAQLPLAKGLTFVSPCPFISSAVKSSVNFSYLFFIRNSSSTQMIFSTFTPSLLPSTLYSFLFKLTIVTSLAIFSVSLPHINAN